MGRIIQMVLAVSALTLGGGQVLAQPASIGTAEPLVIAPNAAEGASFMGCYRANQTIAGRHRLNFCFERRGSFRVTGAQMCDGSMTWRVAGRTISSDFHRTRCSSGVWWERASMTCNPTGRLLPANADSGKFPRVSALRCTYRATSPRMRNITFIADRN